MNKNAIDLSTPKTAGWHWWKASKDAQPVDIKVSEEDVRLNKYKGFGGEWHHFPNFDEVMDYRQAYYDLYQRAKTNEENLRNAECGLVAFTDFLTHLSRKVLVPKKEITEFLEKVKQNSTQANPRQ